MEAFFSSETFLLTKLNGVATQTQKQNNHHRENITVGPFKFLFMSIKTFIIHNLCIFIVRLYVFLLFIVRPCILNVVYVFVLLSMYSYCSSIYYYCCLCLLIVVYVFLLFVHILLLLSMSTYCCLCILRRSYPD